MPYDLQDYKLTLPINENGEKEGEAHEIFFSDEPEFDNEYFQQGETFKQFIVDGEGATTPNTDRPRTELRHLEDVAIGADKVWDELKFSVESLTEDTGVVVYQIHSVGSKPALKVVFEKDKRIRAFIRTSPDEGEVKIDLDNALEKEIFSIKVEYTAGKIRLRFDHRYVFDAQLTGYDTPLYEKKGAYIQDGGSAHARIRHY